MTAKYPVMFDNKSIDENEKFKKLQLILGKD